MTSSLAASTATDDVTSLTKSASASTVTASESTSTATSDVTGSSASVSASASDVRRQADEDEPLTSSALELRRKNCERDFAKSSPREGKETDSAAVTSAARLSQPSFVLSYSGGTSARYSSPYGGGAAKDLEGRVLTSRAASGTVQFDETAQEWKLSDVAFNSTSGRWQPIANEDCASADLVTGRDVTGGDVEDDRASIDSNSSYERELEDFGDAQFPPAVRSQPPVATSSLSDPGITYVMSQPRCDVTSATSSSKSSCASEAFREILKSGAGDSVARTRPEVRKTSSPFSLDSGFAASELASLRLSERTTSTSTQSDVSSTAMTSDCSASDNVSGVEPLNRTQSNNASDDASNPQNAACTSPPLFFQSGASK